MLPWHYAMAAACGLVIAAAVIRAGRLAADVTGNVSLPQGEPDPSGLSRNGVR